MNVLNQNLIMYILTTTKRNCKRKVPDGILPITNAQKFVNQISFAPVEANEQ